VSKRDPPKGGGERQRKATRDLFDWLNAVKDDDKISPVVFKVAFEIAQHFNFSRRHRGAAWPALATIAANINTDKKTVIRAVHQLRERGLLTVEPGRPGRGHPNRYRMSKPKIKGGTTPPFQPGEKVASRPERVAPRHQNHLEPSIGGATAPPYRERVGSLALASPGARSPYGGAHHHEAKNQEILAPGDGFTELIEIWQRPWGDEDADAARKAFAVACREADPDTIIANARRWVEAFAAEPRHLMRLEKWLAKGAWKKQPPSRRQQRNKGKVSMVETVLRVGRVRS
jgi:hypothetical protein